MILLVTFGSQSNVQVDRHMVLYCLVLQSGISLGSSQTGRGSSVRCVVQHQEGEGYTEVHGSEHGVPPVECPSVWTDVLRDSTLCIIFMCQNSDYHANAIQKQ